MKLHIVAGVLTRSGSSDADNISVLGVFEHSVNYADSRNAKYFIALEEIRDDDDLFYKAGDTFALTLAGKLVALDGFYDFQLHPEAGNLIVDADDVAAVAL